MNRDEFLLSFIQQHEAACPVCAYALSGLETPKCPECGAGLELRVGTSTPRMGPWLLALISVALALGFDGVASLMMTIGLVNSPPPPASTQAWQVYLAYGTFTGLTLAGLVGVLLLLRLRRRVWKLQPSRGWTLAVGLFIAIGVLHALVGLKIAGLI